MPAFVTYPEPLGWDWLFAENKRLNLENLNLDVYSSQDELHVSQVHHTHWSSCNMTQGYIWASHGGWGWSILFCTSSYSALEVQLDLKNCPSLLKYAIGQMCRRFGSENVPILIILKQEVTKLWTDFCYYLAHSSTRTRVLPLVHHSKMFLY